MIGKNHIICFQSILIYILLNSFYFSQSDFNITPTKSLIREFELTKNKNINSNLINSRLNLIFNQYAYFNSNLINLENQNGLYLPKGFGSITGIILGYYGDYITLTAEPRISQKSDYKYSIPAKEKLFSVLNDVPINNYYKERGHDFRNLGLKLHYKNLSIGYGNWNRWWGPGIHNSLVMSNNAEGFYHFFLSTRDYISLSRNVKINFEYLTSSHMQNFSKIDYFLSAFLFKVKYKNFELGASRNILSGGNNNIPWNIADAFILPITNKNIRYWDQIYDLYLLYNSQDSGLFIFYELGIPNRSFNGARPDEYIEHGLGTNIGIRKYGVFGKDEIIIGFEYTRLVQGIYYNLLPTPNWYDNIKYNYSSYMNRRWAAHSGADSDDFLVFLGYMDKNKSFIYEINYERHGVTYHFPPEVKIESRISASYKLGSIFISLNYENEYFEHYGFLDSNINVWNETFEEGSLQRTNTLLLSIEYSLFSNK